MCTSIWQPWLGVEEYIRWIGPLDASTGEGQAASASDSVCCLVMPLDGIGGKDGICPSAIGRIRGAECHFFRFKEVQRPEPRLRRYARTYVRIGRLKWKYVRTMCLLCT
jgi:hypothetical protein